MPAEQLSGTIFVIIIAVGVQACIILSIFVKRQVQRFSLRNRRGPHTSIGHGGPKSLRREIDRILDYVPYIKHEPLLEPLSPHSNDWRRLTILGFQSLEMEIAKYSQNYIRPSVGSMRSHLLNCTNGPLLGADTNVIHQVCDGYNNARYHYEEVDSATYKLFLERLNMLMDTVARNKIMKPCPSPLPLPASSSPRKSRGNKRSAAGAGDGRDSSHYKRAVEQQDSGHEGRDPPASKRTFNKRFLSVAPTSTLLVESSPDKNYSVLRV